MPVHRSAAARALLPPGESLLAALAVPVAPGNLPHRPPPDPPVFTRYKFAIVYSLALGLTKPWDYLSDPASDRLYGVAAAGEPGSRAAELVRARLRIHPTLGGVTVVTDRRLLLCAEERTGRLVVRWESPRSEIVRTYWQRYRLRARFCIEFIDGSWISHATSRLESNRPIRELAAAFDRT